MTREDITEKLMELAGSRQNTLRLLDKPAFAKPLAAFGAGDDGLLDFFREDIGPFYRLPDEWLTNKYGRPFERRDISILSWVMPQTEETRLANEKENRVPSYPWALNRTYGEEFQRDLAKAMEDWLDSEGIAAVAPMASPDFKWETSEKYGYASLWSERHTAYLCGLGTFGLCDGLISPLGKAVRYGSVVFALKLEPDKRPYTRYNEYCIADLGCRACVDRCPAGAITPEGGHDKNKCRDYQVSIMKEIKEKYGFEGTYGCGLCQTGTPCERGIPHRPAE